MEKSQNKVKTFLRKNLSYLVIALCVFAVGLATILVALQKEANNLDVSTRPGDESVLPDDSTEGEQNPSDKPTSSPVEPEEIVFMMPVESFNDVHAYSEVPVFNLTLERYAVHKGTDFMVEEGTQVFAVYHGEIESIENSLLTGYSVTVDHGNGLKTVYNSLGDVEDLAVGQAVEKGDVLGVASTTNRQEYKSGAHLHFEVNLDGVEVDPANYLVFDEK